LQVTLCDPCLSALRTRCLSSKALYKSTYLYLYIHITLYTHTYRTGVNCYYPLCSPFRGSETWSSLVPDDVSGIEDSASPVLRRGTVCRRTSVLHQHCVLSKICSRLICFCIHFNHRLNFEKRMLYGALVVTLWTCYGALYVVVLLLLLLSSLYKSLYKSTYLYLYLYCCSLALKQSITTCDFILGFQTVRITLSLSLEVFKMTFRLVGSSLAIISSASVQCLHTAARRSGHSNHFCYLFNYNYLQSPRSYQHNCTSPTVPSLTRVSHAV